MMEKSLVSIITPTYNCGKFIAESIRCVQSQTYSNWEMIIVDDCSTDNTKEIVESFGDSRIKYFVNPTNSGAAVSRNRALREAKGRWIAFLDSDDLWLPEKLERQIHFMEEHHYGFSYTNYCEIDENSQELGNRISGPNHISCRGMYNYCWPGCLTVMYDVSVVGLIQIADIKKNNDYAIWLKAIRKTGCHLLNENLAKYRRRTGSISNHGYGTMINWHYRLFHDAEKQCAAIACLNTIRNLYFGLIKKIFYVKKYSV